MIKTLFLALFALLSINLQAQTSGFLTNLLQKADSSYFTPFLKQENGHEIQIVYGQIDRSSGIPRITHHFHNLHSNYWYPASSIKLPVAALALEFVHKLGIEGLDKNSKIIHGASRPEQSLAVFDSSALELYPSIGHYIRKVCLYSDNDAYNRLFELLGQSYINERLMELGVRAPRILHRVGISGFDAESNKWINPISIFNGDSLAYYRGAAFREYRSNYIPQDQLLGKGFYKDGNLINEPMDFSSKNYIPLDALLSVIERVMMPEAFAKNKQLNISREDYKFLWKAMGQYPKESMSPKLNDMEDGYVKFFLNGGEGKRINKHTRIFNKVGFAYGYLTDVAYIVDFKNQVEFFLGAVIHVNENRIFN
ncbi:MAG: hypothetical protein HKN16_10085, partial [Saprospiraceae bacterium]|nr:hypothetical protein [Saprospiraceae bacterium]